MAGPISPPQTLNSRKEEKEDDFEQFVTETRLTHPSSPGSNVAVWTPERLDLLKNTLAKDLNSEEFLLFVEVCKRRRLDPFAKQIYGQKRNGKLVIITAIDGYRLIAERTGKYLGQTPPLWCGKDGIWKEVWAENGHPFVSKIGVHRQGQIEPTWGLAYWDTYVAPGPFWQKSGASQLSKCAEALALRKAFPEELSGIYTAEEMDNTLTDTMVVAPINAPAADDTAQPVLIFPISTKALWQDPQGNNCGIVIDTADVEWIYAGNEHSDAINKAIADNTHMLVYFVVDTGRRVITKIEG